MRPADSVGTMVVFVAAGAVAGVLRHRSKYRVNRVADAVRAHILAVREQSMSEGIASELLSAIPSKKDTAEFNRVADAQLQDVMIAYIRQFFRIDGITGGELEQLDRTTMEIMCH